MRGPHMRAQGAAADERGNVMILLIFLFIPIVVAFALVTQLACVYMIRTVHANDLSVARECTLTPDFGMLVKSSYDPGRDLASELASVLRSNSVKSEIKVWFVESSSAKLDAANRAMAYFVEICDDSDEFGVIRGDSTLAGGIMDNLEVYSSISGQLYPYSNAKIYKPSNPDTSLNSGKVELYTFAERQNSYTVEYLEPEDAPQPLIDAITEAVNKASEVGSTNGTDN